MTHSVWGLLGQALLETLYMVALSGLVSTLLGGALGVFVYTTGPGRIQARPLLHRLLGMVINATRSVPFIILLVAVIPLTRLLTGTSIGTTAAIVPLTLAAIPFVARVTENALQEVGDGVVEAAQSMGATPWQIVSRFLLPEALPGLVRGITLTLVTLVNYSAMAGAIGGGGLGDLGIRYGYQRFDPMVMGVTVAVLVVVVQCIQMAGEWVHRRSSHGVAAAENTTKR